MLCYYMPVGFVDIVQGYILQGNILHKNISQLALASLQTSHEHVVFAQLLQVVNKFETSCEQLLITLHVDVFKLVARLFQQL